MRAFSTSSVTVLRSLWSSAWTIIAISYNPELHSRTKHIDRRHFFIRECVENMQLRVPYVKSVDNLADFFTKPLAKNDYFRMRDILMNVPASDRVPVSRNRAPLVRGGV